MKGLIKWLRDGIKSLHEPEKSKKTTRKPSTPVKEPKKDYFHLSLLGNYLRKYSLNCLDDSSFSELRSRILKDGKRYTLSMMKAALSPDDYGSYKAIAEKVLDAYDGLKDEKISLEKLGQANEDRNTPKIYLGAIGRYLKDFNLEEEAKDNFKETIFIVMDRLYNEGKDQMVTKFQVNMKWLEKYCANDDQEKIGEEIKRTRLRINESLEDNQA